MGGFFLTFSFCSLGFAFLLIPRTQHALGMDNEVPHTIYHHKISKYKPLQFLVAQVLSQSIFLASFSALSLNANTVFCLTTEDHERELFAAKCLMRFLTVGRTNLSSQTTNRHRSKPQVNHPSSITNNKSKNRRKLDDLPPLTPKRHLQLNLYIYYIIINVKNHNQISQPACIAKLP